MSFLGEMFGYDSRDNDLLGYPRDENNACIACGVSVSAHSPAMEAACVQKIFAKRETKENTP